MHRASFFIDEIDAVARRRGTGMGGGHDEREQTFEPVTCLRWTDSVSMKESLSWQQRTVSTFWILQSFVRDVFDRKVVVGRPDVQGREEIFKGSRKGKTAQ